MLVMPDDLAAFDVDGTLSPDFLAMFDVELDFANAKVNLFKPLTCNALPVYWTKTDPFAELTIHKDQWGHIYTDVVLDGKPMTAQIDTGTTTSFMNLDTAKALFGLGDNDITKVIDRSGDVRSYRYPFREMTLGDVKVLHPLINLSPVHSVGNKIVLGMGVLRQLHFYISYKNSKIYATGASSVALGSNGKAGLWEERVYSDTALQSDGKSNKVSQICATQEMAEHPLQLIQVTDRCTRNVADSKGNVAHVELSCPGSKRLKAEISFDSPERRSVIMTQIQSDASLSTKYELHRISAECGELAPGARRDVSPESTPQKVTH
jgi:hypothetical protein